MKRLILIWSFINGYEMFKEHPLRHDAGFDEKQKIKKELIFLEIRANNPLRILFFC